MLISGEQPISLCKYLNPNDGSNLDIEEIDVEKGAEERIARYARSFARQYWNKNRCCIIK